MFGRDRLRHESGQCVEQRRFAGARAAEKQKPLAALEIETDGTDGIAFGFISYSTLKLAAGRAREAHWLVYLFAVLFLARYAFLGA